MWWIWWVWDDFIGSKVYKFSWWVWWNSKINFISWWVWWNELLLKKTNQKKNKIKSNQKKLVKSLTNLVRRWNTFFYIFIVFVSEQQLASQYLRFSSISRFSAECDLLVPPVPKTRLTLLRTKRRAVSVNLSGSLKENLKISCGKLFGKFCVGTEKEINVK